MYIKNIDKLKQSVQHYNRSPEMYLTVFKDGSWQISNSVQPEGWRWVNISGESPENIKFLISQGFLSPVFENAI
jgi:hypothetical protein